MQDQVVLVCSGGLGLVGNDATDETGVSASQSSHQTTELFSVHHGYSLHGATLALLLLLTTGLLLWCFGNCREASSHEFKARLLQKLDDTIVERILVLLKPVVQVVTDLTGIMPADEVSVTLVLAWLGLDEGWV